MPPITDIAPPTIESPETKYQREQYRALRSPFDEAPAFGDVVMATAQNAYPAVWTRQLYDLSFPDDPNFKLDAKLFDQLTGDLPPELWSAFGTAKSLDHANYLRSQMLARRDSMQTLADAGFTGIATQVVGSLIDPANIAVMLATGGLGTAAGVGGIVKAGAVAGAGMAALESTRLGDDPTMTPTDVVKAGAIGFGFGAAAHATPGMARLPRFVIGGASAAAPGVAFDVMQGKDRDQIKMALLQNFMLSGVFNALPGTRPDTTATYKELAPVIRRQMDEVRTGVVDMKAAEQRATEMVVAQTAATRTGRQFDNFDHADQIEANIIKELGNAYPKPDQLSSLPPNSEIARLTKEALIAEPPKGVRVVEQGNLGVRIAGDGAVELGQRFLTARSAEREAMLNTELFLKPMAANRVIETGKTGNAAIMDIAKHLDIRPKEARDVYEAIRSRVYDLANPHVESLPPEVLARFVPVETGNPTQIIAEGQSATTPGVVEGVGAASPNSPMFQPAPITVAKEHGDLFLDNVTGAKSIMVGRAGSHAQFASFGMSEMVGQSPVTDFRMAANAYGYDPLPKQFNEPSVFSASEWREARKASEQARWNRVVQDSYAEHIKWTKGQQAQPLTIDTFLEQASFAKRRGITSTDPGMDAIIRQADSIIKDMHALQQRHNVPGFNNFDHDATYLPRFHHPYKIDEGMVRFGQGQLTDLYSRAIQAKSQGIDPEVAGAMAEAIIRRAQQKINGHMLDISRLLSSAGGDELGAILRAETNLSPARIENIVRQVTGGEADASAPARAKFRIGLDETYRMQLTDRATGQKVNVGVEDFLENNLNYLTHRYVEASIGQSALHEGFRVLAAPGEAPATSIQMQVERLAKAAQQAGLRASDYQTDLVKIERMMKMVAGIPLQDFTAYTRIAQNLRRANFIRLLSNFTTGFQNLSDLPYAMAQSGMKAVASVMPEVPSIINTLRTGRATTETLRELEILGIGVDFDATRPLARGLVEDGGAQAIMNSAEMGMARAQRIASVVSLQTPGTTLMQLVTARMIQNKWAELALSGRALTSKRLAGLGIEPAMAARINDQINTHTIREKGLLGVTMRRMNLDAWTDIEAAAKFRGVVLRETNRLILKNNPAGYANWMTTETGKLIAQMRNYAFSSHRTRLLHGLHMRDAETATSWITSAATASLFYAASVYVNSIGRPDADEFREKMLAPDMLAKAAASRAAWSALLPVGGDAVIASAGGQPQFASARSSGLQGGPGLGFLLQNPTLDWFNAVTHMPQAFFGSTLNPDYEFSRQDVQAIQDGLFLPRVWGLKQIIDHTTENLPRKSVSR